MTQIVIKPIKENDEAATTLIRHFFRLYLQELNEDLAFQQVDDELSNPFLKYAEPGGTIALAFYNNEPAGCVALYKLDEKSCEMKRLFVLPAFRKHKIGEALVHFILNNAKEKAYQLMKLDTLKKLQPAIALYRKCGFTETTSYYHNPLQDVIYMQKQLFY